jgi:Bacteriophage lambda head decoration protein D
MTILTEGQHTGEAILGEEDSGYSRDVVTLAAGLNGTAMMVLGKITVSGKYTQQDPAAVDGSQNAAAILFDNVDATLADKKAVILNRVCSLNGKELVWKTGMTAPQIATATAALKALGIIVR